VGNLAHDTGTSSAGHRLDAEWGILHITPKHLLLGRSVGNLTHDTKTSSAGHGFDAYFTEGLGDDGLHLASEESSSLGPDCTGLTQHQVKDFTQLCNTQQAQRTAGPGSAQSRLSTRSKILQQAQHTAGPGSAHSRLSTQQAMTWNTAGSAQLGMQQAQHKAGSAHSNCHST
jgi:hypothetical protein